jgi:glycosyltransferase involved in cell wall biosynthesis
LSSVIAYDVARLFLGPLSVMPRGIDRVDLALARHFFAPDAPQTAFGILPTPWGIRAFPASRVRRGLARLEEFWAEDVDAEADPVWAQLRQRMRARGSTQAPPSLARGRRGASLAARLWRLCRSLAATGVGLGHPVRSFLPRGTVYINVGQITLAVPMLFRWLGDRPDIAALFMLHDAIPVQRPELVDVSSARHHSQMIATAARYADGLIVSTAAAAEEIESELGSCGRHEVPALVRTLPLTSGFMRGTHAHPELDDVDYFVVCGTIEPRKNHALLFEVWQKLIERDGLAAPHLVMVGTPGWSADKLFALLDGKPLLRGRVHHAAGLSTPALAQLIAGSRALLVPSLAEGFSLPLLEARALGVPVVASDIPVHRERADAGVRLLPVDDRMGWLAAVDATPHRQSRGLCTVDPALGERAYYEDIARFAQLRLDAKLGQSPPEPTTHQNASHGTARRSEPDLVAEQPGDPRKAIECA